MEAANESQSTPQGRFLGNRIGWVSAILALAGGAALRLWMMKTFPQISGDTLLYGTIAKNVLLHGRFALTDGSGVLHETLIRLPGYPLFLALCFRLFGVDNYNAVIFLQIAMELAGCVLLGFFVQRIAPANIASRAAHCTMWLAALCPFTASYAVAPLTETATLFAIALALWAMAAFSARPRWGNALAFTFAVTFAAMLRPDGALVGIALVPGLLLAVIKTRTLFEPRITRMTATCVLLAVLPFAAWAVRNYRVFHVIQPLAPRYATDPGEDVHAGWQRWVKTWCLDFVSTYDIYWNVPDGPFNLNKLPARAFDSAAQYAETAAIAREYEDNGEDFSPQIDSQLAQLAAERIHDDPLRYYLWLPLGRMADMWLRPRVENLPIDLDWWVYSHHWVETRFSWAYAGLNAAYILLAVIGLLFRPRFAVWMVLYMVLRSALLMTIEAPEARYTLECFPMLFALGGVGIAGILKKRHETGKGVA